MTDNGDIRIETIAEGLISRILIERPAKRNALSLAMLERFVECVDIATDSTSRVIVVQSPVSGVFSAGADIAYLGTPDDARGEELLQALSVRLQKAPKVTIAISDGLTIGAGLVVFLSCDIRLATSKSVFRMPPVRLARVYELEGTKRFVRTIGLTAATEMLVTARQYDLDEAQKCHLVTRAVSGPDDALMYCIETAQLPPLAQQATKMSLYVLGRDLTGERLEDSALAEIEAATHLAQGSEDSREALRAFHEKRSPVFVGR